MNYVYELVKDGGRITQTTTRLGEISTSFKGEVITVFDSVKQEVIETIHSEETLDCWYTSLERDFVWLNGKPKTARYECRLKDRFGAVLKTSARVPDFMDSFKEGYVLEVKEISGSTVGAKHFLFSRQELKQWLNNAGIRCNPVNLAIEENGDADNLFSIQKDAATAVNPDHYRNYLNIAELNCDLQWCETMQYLPSYLGKPAHFKAALEMQARKYIDRLGRKDDNVQEIQKAIWYLRFLAAYTANGDKPIRVSDIPKILGE